MIKVLLINQDKIPHYRVPIYNYLSMYLQKSGFMLTVASGGIQDGNPHAIRFDYSEYPLSFLNIVKNVLKLDPAVIIFWVNLKYMYLFPTLFFIKVIGIKAIYWGHGRDLLDTGAKRKNLFYALEHWICDAIILYADYLKQYVLPKHYFKVFVANNTLNMTEHEFGSVTKELVLEKYHIKTKKNIICVGKMDKRKRIRDLLKAFDIMNDQDLGLILVGPDTDGILRELNKENVYVLGPIYDDDKLALLSAADVYCLPGTIGLSIVDAFYCGLPIVTEDCDNSPEIMYLKDGVNGFVVPNGDYMQLAAKLKLLLENDKLRTEFSAAAKNEIMTKGNIDVMCKGFEDALRFVS